MAKKQAKQIKQITPKSASNLQKPVIPPKSVSLLKPGLSTSVSKSDKKPEQKNTALEKNLGNKKQKILLERPFRRVGGVFPKRTIAYFGEKLRFAGLRDDPKVWLGTRFMLSAFIGLVFVFIFFMLNQPDPTIENILIACGTFLFGLFFCALLFYLRLYFIISDRASSLEKILPDFLLLAASNLRAGMTPFNAFVHSAKPKFGPLYQEVHLAAAKATGTASLVDALIELGNYFDSKLFRRTVILFAKGMRSGGQLAKLLRANADEAQHIQDLRAELTTATRTYTLFLGFVIVIIMPFLLSIATLFVTVFLTFQPDSSGLDAESLGGVPMFSGKILITPTEMTMMAVGTLILTSLLVSALSGLIQKGHALYGIKYFPVFAIVSVVFYFLSHMVIGSMLMNFGG